MQLAITPGKYIVAVSGGVDSMVLLHMLKSIPELDIVVAHLNHGIRNDTQKDAELVRAVAIEYGLTFVGAAVELGEGVSEAAAREARYGFLERVRLEQQASAIITAHHQDDVIETAIINLSRGTGWRGLVALGNTSTVLRPLLKIPKSEIVTYANEHQLKWREDSTNSDQKYLRNYIRLTVLPKLSPVDRSYFVRSIEQTRQIGAEIDTVISELLEANLSNNELNRTAFKSLDKELIQEMLIGWWRRNGFYSYETKTLRRAVSNVLAMRSGQIVPLKGKLQMTVKRTVLALNYRER